MEEVWKDINLSTQDSLSSDIHHRSHSNFRNGGIILQDFLARPFNLDPPTSVVSTADICLFGSLAAAETSAPILSLNAGHGLHLETPNIFNSSSGLLPSFGKKRLSGSDQNTGGDRRYKRMIKNRESAARSRARKQAYTNELELEVSHLMEENARLKRQQEQLCTTASAAQHHPKKHTLHRTSTAPF